MAHLLWPTRSEQYFLLAHTLDPTDELDEFNEAPHVLNSGYTSLQNSGSAQDLTFTTFCNSRNSSDLEFMKAVMWSFQKRWYFIINVKVTMLGFLMLSFFLLPSMHWPAFPPLPTILALLTLCYLPSCFLTTCLNHPNCLSSIVSSIGMIFSCHYLFLF